MTDVVVETWHSAFPDHAVGGSVYAVEPSLRVTAAMRLSAAGCRVHADIILGPDQLHCGVSWDELSEIRKASPIARIDLHLITLAEPVGPAGLAEECRAIEAALEIGAEWITVGEQQLAQHAKSLAAARRSGVDIWLEIRPQEPGLRAPTAGVDGALIMFIEPGTKQTADPAHLQKIRRLARILPVGADGGITRVVAARCLQAGARYVVSGRDLLTVIAGQPVKQLERDPLP
jgi:pentose-5-phosphate-3-epimerase